MISIIYVSYNSGEEILASIASLRESGCNHPLQIIAVDNASPDDSATMLRAQPDIHLIANEVNLGYGRAVNQGMEVAEGDIYLVLNPDVTVNPGAVDRLYDFMMENPRVGIAGARLLNEDGSLQHSCRSFYTFWTIFLRRTPLGKLFPRSGAIRHHLMLDFDHQSARRVDWVIGACMMVRPHAVEDVGGMDKRFFLYFEDVDWCYRMGQRGWEVWYVPEAEMNHLHKRASAGGNPFSRSLLIHITSFIHYTEKWNPISYLVKRYRDPLKGLTLLLLDFLAINLSLITATWLRLKLAGLFTHTYYVPEAYERFSLFFNIITLGTFYLTGLYRTNRRVGASEELLLLSRAGLIAGLTLMGTTYLTHERIVSRAVVLLSVPLLVFFTLMFRKGLRSLQRVFLRYNFDLRRILIVGSGDELHELDTMIMRHPEMGLDLVGRVTPCDIDERGALGTLSELEKVCVDERVQEIIFAPSAGALSAVASTLVWCRSHNIDLRVLSDLAGVMSRGARVEDFLGLPAIAYRMGGMYLVQRILKRTVDIVVALPLLILTWLPGRLLRSRLRHSGRAALHITPVQGLKGRSATLPLLLNEGGVPVSDLLNPWLWGAVLRGDLSLVGPMPRAKGGAELNDLLDMRPGLTGYWRRSTEEAVSREGMDLLYLRNWSAGLDLQLWLSTLGTQLRGEYPRHLCPPGPTEQGDEKGAH